MSQALPNAHSSSAPPEVFAGRVDERQEFGQSVRYVLGRDQPPANDRLYPHLFLISGEGGTGKSALLRQFRAIAIQSGLDPKRIITIELRIRRYPDARVFAQVLAEAIKSVDQYQDKV